VNGLACASHPFIGARPYRAGKQRLIEAMVNIAHAPRFCAARAADRAVPLHDVASDHIEQLYPLLNTDVTADHARWGGSAHFGGATYAARGDRPLRTSISRHGPAICWARTSSVSASRTRSNNRLMFQSKLRVWSSIRCPAIRRRNSFA
jgi:hypothetical protein